MAFHSKFVWTSDSSSLIEVFHNCRPLAEDVDPESEALNQDGAEVGGG
jgi:hypothetical protein